MDQLVTKLLGEHGMDVIMLGSLTMLFWRLRVVEQVISRKLENGMASGLRRVEEDVAAIKATCQERARQGH